MHHDTPASAIQLSWLGSNLVRVTQVRGDIPFSWYIKVMPERVVLARGANSNGDPSTSHEHSEDLAVAPPR